MKLGFTGTQIGMTNAQKEKFCALISQINPSEFHHGDCIGADKQAHLLVRKLSKSKIYLHPPLNTAKRAFCTGDFLFPADEYLNRNKYIIEKTEYLIGMPKEFTEQIRSGTWSTIRYALKKNIQVYAILPDGTNYFDVNNFDW